MTDKYVLPMFFSGTILLLLFVFFIVAYLIVQKQKQHAYFLERSKLIFDHQSKLLKARTEEQVRTMNLMSVEIHDNIGQVLNFIKMNLRVIDRNTKDAEQRELVEMVSGLVDEVMKSTRNISHTLNSGYIKAHGLIKVLSEEMERINAGGEITGKIDVIGNEMAFNADKELLIYRIAQEAIHNVSKHARASRINITLTFGPKIFTMSISDDGVGFHHVAASGLDGIGFQNMMHRAVLLSGGLDIESQPGQGCVVTFRSEVDTLRSEVDAVNHYITNNTIT